MMSTEHLLSAGFGSLATAPTALRGRGAVINVRHRFEQIEREAFDNGWFGGDDAPVHLDPSPDDLYGESLCPREVPAVSEDSRRVRPRGAEIIGASRYRAV